MTFPLWQAFSDNSHYLCSQMTTLKKIKNETFYIIDVGHSNADDHKGS